MNDFDINYDNKILEFSYAISKKYAVSVDDLKRWNYLYDNSIKVGQKLTVKTETFN